MIAVTFDVGQTLLDLDHDLLARQIAKHGVEIDPRRSAAVEAAGWAADAAARRSGASGAEAWSAFMTALLEQCGVPRHGVPALVRWLYDQQPTCNLWRRPAPGMIDLAGDLARAGVPVGIVSNSEGRVAELLADAGVLVPFRVVADSGLLGFEKPDPRIFEHAARALGVPATSLVHVGDSWEGDVLGALGVGARALWLTAKAPPSDLPDGVRVVRDAGETRAALRGWSVAGA